MSATVLTFFNNKGGVGKTSLVYHVAWMLSEMDHSVLAVDLDPQANLTAAFLDEDVLEGLWDGGNGSKDATIYQCVRPLAKGVSGVQSPALQEVGPYLHLLPGDLALSGFEDLLSSEWPNCLASGSDALYRAFRVVTSFWQAIQSAAEQCEAQIVLVDVGPSLGAINRSALIATDFVVVPLGADLFSRQGLRNLGPTLRDWRGEWVKRKDQWQEPEFDLPAGTMKPIGYLIQQHGVRLTRQLNLTAHDRWAKQMPQEYTKSVLAQEPASTDPTLADDPNRIATIKPYRSLVALGKDARKPIFLLAPADGAIESHAQAANQAYDDFRALSKKLLGRCGLPLPPAIPRWDP